MTWHVHIANCSGVLTEFLPEIRTALADAERKVTAVTGPFDMDVVVQDLPGRGIPELGFVGHAPTGSLVHLSFDRDNKNLSANLGEPLGRVIAHEANHVLRWRGPGYGTTLGAALVSEGLAGQFSKQIYGNTPEPWELPIDEDLDVVAEVIAQWSGSYDHMEWFFGTGKHPLWLGYRLGYRIVGRHIDMSKRNAWELTDHSADEFLVTLRSLAT